MGTWSPLDTLLTVVMVIAVSRPCISLCNRVAEVNHDQLSRCRRHRRSVRPRQALRAADISRPVAHHP